jgi:hypothetical protein
MSADQTIPKPIQLSLACDHDTSRSWEPRRSDVASLRQAQVPRAQEVAARAQPQKKIAGTLQLGGNARLQQTFTLVDAAHDLRRQEAHAQL